MNNFTKSIVYSGVVMAAGLVAIFAVYNNMDNASSLSSMEPAAGQEMTMEEQEAMSGFAEIANQIESAAGDTMDAATEMATEMSETATDAATMAAEKATDAVTETAASAMDATKDAATAATDMATKAMKMEPAAGDVVEHATEAAHDAVADHAADAVAEHAEEAAHDAAEHAVDAAVDHAEDAATEAVDHAIDAAHGALTH